ncbi:hypothetical protein GCM10025734_11580 [Kitasatospora paranensis]
MTAAPPRNWAGNVTFRAARVHRPSSVAELQEIVAAARSVRALGTGHSFNRIADTDGDLVRVDGLPGRVEIDPAALTATVPAGLRYARLAEHLQAHGFALANLASLPQISVAGACATGTHGSGNGRPGLAAAVAGLRMVAPDGRLVELRRGVPEDRLDGAVVALGALGIVTELTLDIEPTYDVAQWVYTGLPLDRLAGAFDALSGAAYSVSVFTDWASGEARVWLKCRTDRDGSDHPGDSWQGARLAGEALHPIPGIFPAACTTQGGRPARGTNGSRTSDPTSPPAAAPNSSPSCCCRAAPHRRPSRRCAASATGSRPSSRSRRSAPSLPTTSGSAPLTLGTAWPSTSPGATGRRP